jgi:hypothetical protein
MSKVHALRGAAAAEPVRCCEATLGCHDHLGTLVGFDARGAPLVRLDGEAEARAAATTVALRKGQIGARAVVLCSDGERIVTGVVRAPGAPELAPVEPAGRTVEVDGERVLLSAEREIELRCGKASIRLTADGKIVVRGAELLQVSSGLHRLQGAAVEIN